MSEQAKPGIDFARLREPFDPKDIEWRLQSCGEKGGKFWAKVLAYITARAVMDRLDEVLGVDGWQVTYKAGPAGGVMAELSIRVPKADGGTEWITKSDGADTTDVEAVKGGYSAALKRVAVTVGIGRYLYDLEEGWANVHEKGAYFGQTKDKQTFRWDPPTLPEWARPKAKATATPKTNGNGHGGTTAPAAKLASGGELLIATNFAKDAKTARTPAEWMQIFERYLQLARTVEEVRAIWTATKLANDDPAVEMAKARTAQLTGGANGKASNGEARAS